MRSIGRRVREGSPRRVKVWGWEAMRPVNMRMVEPELPQSRGAEGWRKAPATPVISMVLSGLRRTRAPRDSMQASEE